MKPVGIILIGVGVLALLIGLVVCVNTLTSDYASSACESAASDKKLFDEAKATCGSTSSDCYKRLTGALTSESDCENNKSFMTKQLIMGIVPVVIGFLLAIVGFFVGRKKAVT